MLALDLSDRKVVLSGATGNLGPSIARTLASAGAEMHLLYRSNSAAAHSLAEEVSGKAWQVDLDDPAACRSLAESIGVPWGLVLASSPGMRTIRAIEEGTAFQEAWQGSVGHALNLIRAFCPGMAQVGMGRIVALSSENVEMRYAGGGPYASSKRALEGLLATLVAELGPSGITVNAVAPGWINVGEAEDSWYTETVPLARRGAPEDVANAVAYLLSDLAEFVSGAWLPVNGGKATRL